MGAVQGYLEKLGGNFMIAAFIPSLAFVAACMVAFSPLLPQTFIERVQTSLSPLDDNGFIVLLIAMVMGFTLTSLNTYVYKLFEGYVLLDFLKPLQKLEKSRARKIRHKRDMLNQKIARIERWKRGWTAAKMPEYKEKRFARIEKRIEELTNRRDELATEYDLKYPPLDSMILPSRLGNILRAAEVYPQDRYHADAVILWPRLVWAMDREYMGHVDTANDQCSFLLNSSLLSGIFALLSFIASVYETFFKPVSAGVHANIAYMVAGIFALGVAWFFYSASLLNVTKYGNLIRSSYDLFRFNLIQKLHLKLPINDLQEKDLWKKISDFITVGEQYGEKLFQYPDHMTEEERIQEELREQEELSSISLGDKF